ncbi:MAG: hypothetical protein B9S37_06405 [Verrucomicrobiia bacterium Tous-C3TDCM]|nr:MAG: hypothetical protein B9S37_06405 [Verrucomicrobiae bacterium Tous-C3TDCM]PAZ06306.1 MAG: hypothetical protein CAK88_05245 [Verrucomicrobiae bacterium AMD-G2]
MKMSDHQWIQKVLDGECDEQQFVSFQQRLREDQEFAQLYREYALMQHVLYEEFEGRVMIGDQYVSSQKSTSRRLIGWLSVAAALVLGLVIFAQRERGFEQPQRMATSVFSDDAQWLVNGQAADHAHQVEAAEGETVQLLLGQARFFIDGKTSVQDVPYAELQKKLDAAEQIDNAATWKHMPSVPKKADIFDVDGQKAYVYEAPRPAQGKPWIWYAPVINGDVIIVKHKKYFDAFMKEGITIAGYDIGEVRGAPGSTEKFTKFYDAMIKRGYSKQPILLGQSRGGMMTLSWAFRHPEKVRAWAGIYPVCNLASWSLKYSKKETLADFGMSEEDLLAELKEFNPIDNLAGLAKHKVAMFSVHGDKDDPVPFIDNTKLLQGNYKAAGGTCDVKIIPGGGHEISPAFFECQELIDFVIKHAKQ